MALTVGGLFSGVGGLEWGLQQAGLVPRWHVEIEPYAKSILERRWPDAKIYGDITQVDWSTIEPVDVVCGGFPCFPAGTLILTKRGLIDIKDIIAGDEVWTHRNRWKSVVRHHGSHLAKTVRLRGMGHGEMITTHNHPFWSVSAAAASDPEWIDAEKMEGRFWASPVSVISDVPALPSMVRDSVAFYWCIGRWLADGWTVTHKRISKVPQGQRGSRINSTAMCVHWCAAHGEAEAVLGKLTKAGIHVTRANDAAVTKFVIQSAELGAFLSAFGKLAHGKTVPTWVLGLPGEWRLAFLDGYRTGDGSVNGSGWKATTVSRAVAIGVRLVALSLGWAVSLHFTKRAAICIIAGRTVNQRDTWQIVARKYTAHSSAFVQDGYVFGKVRSVEPTDETQEVFNFEVEEDNSYVADGLCVRNCQDISSAGRRAGILAGGKSGLWREFARCLSVVRPRYAVIENVAGLLSGGDAVPTCHCGATGRDFLADDADLLRVVDVEANNSREYLEAAYVARRDQAEPPEECYVNHARIGAVCVSCGRPVDDGTEKPVYQSWMGRVLGDLAALRYDAEWECLPAAAFGAPHLRYRTFIVAHADSFGHLHGQTKKHTAERGIDALGDAAAGRERCSEVADADSE